VQQRVKTYVIEPLTQEFAYLFRQEEPLDLQHSAPVVDTGFRLTKTIELAEIVKTHGLQLQEVHGFHKP